ncbi:hypothetical protein Tco_0986043 [Tanacetum coccineum]
MKQRLNHKPKIEHKKQQNHLRKQPIWAGNPATPRNWLKRESSRDPSLHYPLNGREDVFFFGTFNTIRRGVHHLLEGWNHGTTLVPVQDTYTNLFSIKMHYAGRFTDYPNKQYVKGETCFVDMIDIGDFNIELVNTVLNCIDEEHLLDEVEVNMSSFKFQIDGEDDTKFIDLIQHNVNVTEDDLEVLDFDSLESDQDDENARSKEFPNRDLAKERIRAYAVETRRNLDFKRNDKRRIRVICNGVVPTLNSMNEYVDKVQGSK